MNTSPTKGPSIFEHFLSILALPVMVIIVIPYYLRASEADTYQHLFSKVNTIVLYAVGILFLLIGLWLFYKSNRLFDRIGKGTLAPWNPTKNLVATGIYKYMRNPMICGVIFMLLGEALLTQSFYTLVWAMLFFVISHVHFVFIEEPLLLKKHGEAYAEYCKKVPRWIPKIGSRQ